MNTATTTLTLVQFAAWLAAALRRAGLRDVKVWTGDTGRVRVYRAQDYVEVSVSSEHYGGPLSTIHGHDRGLRAALTCACSEVLSYDPDAATVEVSGTVESATMDPAAKAQATPTAQAHLGARTGCPCGSRVGGLQSSDCAGCQHDA